MAESNPLTELTEDERLFQMTVRKFARERIAPQVREMDERGLLRPEILRECFELGLMGIGVPEEFGGQSGSLFQSVIAIEELAKVGFVGEGSWGTVRGGRTPQGKSESFGRRVDREPLLSCCSVWHRRSRRSGPSRFE